MRTIRARNAYFQKQIKELGDPARVAWHMGLVQPVSRPVSGDRRRAILDEVPSTNDPDESTATPPQIEPLNADLLQWLAGLLRLEGVPFHYLVPDEQMLPAESIRFFVLDPNWMAALFDGAFSVGRNANLDALIDNQYAGALFEQVWNATLSTGDQPIGGLLIRSELIAGWSSGMQINAYSADYTETPPAEKLSILRRQTLSNDVLLCLFDGIPARIDLHEPTDGLHFGLYNNGQGTYSQTLRYVQRKNQLFPSPTNGNVPEAGSPITETTRAGEQPATVPFRDNQVLRGNGRRVVKMNRVAAAMASQLELPTTKAERLNSAEFALQMIESVQIVSFRNK